MAQWSVSGKRILITGATGGIGLAAAEALAARGADVAIVARSEERGREAKRRIEAAGGGRPADVLIADLSSLSAVRALAAEALRRYPRLDALVNNAGAMYSDRRLTPEGHELTWAVNHLAPFLLTTLLLERLKACAPARVVTTSSDAHKAASAIPFDDLTASKKYSALLRYGETKLANILFTKELARRLEGTGVTACCYHPGAVVTDFGRDSKLLTFFYKWFKPFLRSPEKGAKTLVWLLENPDAQALQGGYFMDEKPRRPSKAARDADAARKLWEISAES
jgi:NAD(P)-dependent dehydrogenase (short-subunit alcohol dehydrogenase family)